MNRKKLPTLLLDTHVWIWLIAGDNALKRSPVIHQIQECVRISAVRVAVISAWEVAMLESKKRIHFSLPCREWIRQGLEAPGILLAELTPEIAVESTRLPGNFHGDPADRILIATARTLPATLVTRDQGILTYAKEGHLDVLPV